MPEFSMLLANNNRSKAYLQTLLAAGIRPAAAILLEEGGLKLPEQTLNDKTPGGKAEGKFIRIHPESGIRFDEKESPSATLAKHGIPMRRAATLDVNSDSVISEVGKLPGDFLVYSGPGGSLLKPPVLALGKRFIHVHPGRLPDFRGSTTLYYSMLLEGKISASVIFMEAELDAGPVLLSMDFPVGDGDADFDYVVDPCVRAAALLAFMRDFDRLVAAGKRQPRGGNTFYIIHPVLKHLALLKAGKRGGRDG